MASCRALLCVAIFALSACSDGETVSREVPRVVVSAAVSLANALRQALDEFERINDATVVLNVAGSDTLATQLLAGASVDLFFSADTRQMDRVEASGGILAPTRVDLLSNQLVVVSHVDDEHVLEITDLAHPRVRRIAMGDPDAVPAGVYAREFLQSIGIWDAVRSRIVPTRNVRAVLAAVEAGNADIGFVYRTDVTLAENVEMAFAIPVDQGPEIRYVAAVTSDAPHEAAARQLLIFLGGGRARRIFEGEGFIALGATSP